MKATLEFNLDDPSEELAHKRAINGTKAYIAMFEVGNMVFRPARKHGYCDLVPGDVAERLNKFCDDEHSGQMVREVIQILESRYYRILESYGIDLNDLE